MDRRPLILHRELQLLCPTGSGVAPRAKPAADQLTRGAEDAALLSAHDVMSFGQTFQSIIAWWSRHCVYGQRCRQVCGLF